MKSRHIAWAVVLVALASGSAAAQTVTGLRMTFYRQGQTTPAVAPFTIPFTDFQCGQPIVNPPTGTVANPSQYRVGDPANPTTADCVKNAAAGDPLLMLQFDASITYVARANWVNTAGASVDSTDSNPFSRPGTPPTAPVRLRIGR